MEGRGGEGKRVKRDGEESRAECREENGRCWDKKALELSVSDKEC